MATSPEVCSDADVDKYSSDPRNASFIPDVHNQCKGIQTALVQKT
jgi:hypothetical protein